MLVLKRLIEQSVFILDPNGKVLGTIKRTGWNHLGFDFPCEYTISRSETHHKYNFQPQNSMEAKNGQTRKGQNT